MISYDDFITIVSGFINNVSNEDEKLWLEKVLHHLRNDQANIMIVGGTGAGKSSTISALFDISDAKVGVGADPETINIDRYEMGNLVLWDTPGLGHGVNEDKRHRENIVNKLMERDSSGEHFLIDLVLVIVDASNCDTGTSSELIDLVINSYAHKDRIIIALNQCDMAMKGRFWNFQENRPEPKLTVFLKQKADSIKRRIRDTNNLNIEPLYYTEGNESQKPYNLSRLFYHIVKNLKSQKAVMVACRKSRDSGNFERDDNNDGGAGYRRKTESSLLDKVRDALGGSGPQCLQRDLMDKVCDVLVYVFEKAFYTFTVVTTTVSNVCSSVARFFRSWW